MAELEPDEEGRKRARSDPAVLDVSLHTAKKLRLEDYISVDAAEEKIAGAAVEKLGREVYEEERENPLGVQKERHTVRDNNGEDDDSGECIHDGVGTHTDVAQPLCLGRSSTEAAPDDDRVHINIAQPPMCAAKASIEADPINEDKGISAHMRKDSKEATVGPRCFTSSTDMLDFFHRLLHGWPLNLDINKYEHLMLEDLLKKGHPEWCEKVGTGVKAFQVRINREFSSRCYYVIRKDGSTKDFSYRKCVDNILPLPKLSEPHCYTSNQNEKGSKVLFNNKVSKAQGSKTQHKTKGRRGTRKDRGRGCGISRHIQGNGNHGGHGIANLGEQRRGKHGGRGSCICGAGFKF